MNILICFKIKHPGDKIHNNESKKATLKLGEIVCSSYYQQKIIIQHIKTEENQYRKGKETNIKMEKTYEPDIYKEEAQSITREKEVNLTGNQGNAN